LVIEFGDIETAVREAGLTPRGAFHPEPADVVPEVDPGTPAHTLIMVGNAGPSMWRAFCANRDPAKDRLDDWSQDILTDIARCFGAAALYPFSPPHLPFQRWACQAEPCHSSPLGILIHPGYGLWHSYRGALAFAERLRLPPVKPQVSPCDTCSEKPCLTTCPVAAFHDNGYEVPACARHLADSAGQDCMDHGCRARRACPVGRPFRYHSDQARFHMDAFLRARRADGPLGPTAVELDKNQDVVTLPNSSKTPRATRSHGQAFPATVQDETRGLDR
jgi:Fe-S-cluster-containing hydrogenase component 2